MTLGDVAADIVAAVISICLLSVVLYFVLWAVAATLTVTQARRRARRRPELLTGLARACTVSDLAEIDDELQQILIQEHGWHTASADRRL